MSWSDYPAAGCDEQLEMNTVSEYQVRQCLHGGIPEHATSHCPTQIVHVPGSVGTSFRYMGFLASNVSLGEGTSLEIIIWKIPRVAK